MKQLGALAIPATILQFSKAAALSVPAPAGNPSSPVNVTARNYTDAEGALLQGFLSLPPVPRGGRVPAVVVLHDASGPDLYEKQRATILANDHGYVGFVADVFGFHAVLPPPDAPWSERGRLAGRFTGNATLFSQRIQAAVDYARGLDEVDETKVALIGYCMGGTGVVHYLNKRGGAPEDGARPVAGAVSVHPSLTEEGPGPDGDIDVPSLFLTGGADFLTSPRSMAKLEADMTAGASDESASWETVRYADIFHGFSNWHSAQGYDARADARSWASAVAFFEAEFDETSDDGEELLPPVPEESVTRVDYVDKMDDDYPLIGYVSMPEGVAEGTVLPVVIVLPHEMDEEGPNRYEKQRATQWANGGPYIGFVADIYSHDRKDTSVEELEELYHSNTTKYLSRIRAAVSHVKSMNGADPDNIALAGFGFGGSGALYYAMSGEAVDASVGAVASFHGELGRVAATVADVPDEGASASAGGLPPGGGASPWGGGGDSGPSSWGGGTDPGSARGGGGDSGPSSWGGGGGSGSSWTGDADASSTRSNGMTRRTSNSGARPWTLIQSGVEGDAMEDVVKLEQALMGMGANYELTRFSGAKDGFTIWNADNFDQRATGRSMDQVNTVFMEVFAATTAMEPPIQTDGESSEGSDFNLETFAPTAKPTKSPVVAPAEVTVAPTDVSSASSFALSVGSTLTILGMTWHL